MQKKNKATTSKNKVETNQTSETNYYDIISLLFLIGLFLIDFMPLFGSIEILGPQFIYLSILNSVIGFYIYKNPSIISEKLILLCKNNTALKAYLIFISLSGISIFAAQNTSLGIVSFSRLIVVLFTLLNLIVLFYNRLHLIYKIAFIVSVSLFLQSFNELYDFIKTLKTDSFVVALRDLKGNTGSINILASSLSLKIPFLLIGIVHFKKGLKWFLVVTLFLAVSLIFFTGSRATYLSLFFETIIFSILYLKFNFDEKFNFFKISYIIISIILSFFVSNQIQKYGNKVVQKESVAIRTEQEIKDNSTTSNIRLLYWQNALKMIEKNPLLGIGLGNWKTESIPYEKLISKERTISNNTHNDFLEITTETGILNGFIYLSIFILLGLINLKKILNTKNQEINTVAFVSLLSLISYSIDSFFNFPLYRPTMQLGFCLLFAFTVLNISETEETKTSFLSNKYAFLVIVTSLLTTYLSFKVFKAYQLENDIKANFLTKNFNLKAGEIVSELPKYPTVFTSGEPFATYAGKYFIQEKNYEQATKYLNIGHKINPYLGRTEYYKSNIASETGKLDSAFIYSKKALEIRPRVKDYYIQAINTAIAINDTLGIIEIHNLYTKFNTEPGIWINTSSALSISKYSNKKLIAFIDEGLKEFPDSPVLLERKKLFENNSKMIKNQNYTNQAVQLFKEKKYQKALETLQQALKEDPTNPKIIKNIAICKSMIK